MEAEKLVNLFDSYWFQHGILNKQPPPPNSERKPSHITLETSNPSLPAISTTSMDELVSSSSISSINSFSPDSVLLARNLQPVFSGKEMKDSLSEAEEDLEVSRTGKKVVEKICSGEHRRRNRGIKNKKNRKLQRVFSKSLSDLEFEEIKGFMELGFVFSEEDKKSDFLATILPGLQRLGLEAEKEKGFGISRPYLSEAWEISKRKENPPLTMSWGELPSVNSKIDMKDYLKSWAHNVASSVN